MTKPRKAFDKVTLLYQGRQIYFGTAAGAKEFFMNMGFESPARQTTSDFLTSVTNPAERMIRAGFEGRPPSTPDEFETAWHGSEERAQLLKDIALFDIEFPIGGTALDLFKTSRQASQARTQ